MNLYATVPLRKAVKAAAVDTGEDLSRVEEIYSSIGVRAVRLESHKTLRLNRRRVSIVVQNNIIGHLPADFRELMSASLLDENGRKVPIVVDTEIFGPIHEVQEDCCAICKLPKGVCELLEQEVTTREIHVPGYEGGEGGYYGYGGNIGGNIGGGVTDTVAVETTTKRIFPNGDYVLEKTFPVLDAGTGEISMATTREVIAVFQIEDCGCISVSPANMKLMQSCCVDAYNNYFAECCAESIPIGVKFFPEDGICQFSKPVFFGRLYIEYIGDLPRKNGDFLIPEVSFEFITASIVESRLRNKKGEQERWPRAKMHKREKEKEMKRILGRIALADILDAVYSLPRV